MTSITITIPKRAADFIEAHSVTDTKWQALIAFAHQKPNFHLRERGPFTTGYKAHVYQLRCIGTAIPWAISQGVTGDDLAVAAQGCYFVWSEEDQSWSIPELPASLNFARDYRKLTIRLIENAVANANLRQTQPT